MNRFTSRLLVLTFIIGLLSLGVSVALADLPTVSNEADCANYYNPYIATPIGDGLYECSPDNSTPPPTDDGPCSLPTGDVGAASACDPCGGIAGEVSANACDPCSLPTGDVGAASACDPCSHVGGEVGAAGDPPVNNCNPPVVNNPAPANSPAQPGNPGEISFNDSDLGVALVQTQDANGAYVLEVFDMHNHTSNGNFMFSITQDDLAPFVGNPPAANTLLHAEGHVAVYVLSTGEIQMNVGPDSEGKIHVKIFNGIPWTHVYGYVIEPA
jgi:hypothetical protein